jgi:transposase
MLLSLGGHSYEIVKTHLQHVITAAAIDVARLLAWIMGVPRDAARISRFAALAS